MGTTSGSTASGRRKADIQAELSLETDNADFDEGKAASSSVPGDDHVRVFSSVSKCDQGYVAQDGGAGGVSREDNGKVEDLKSVSNYFASLAKKAEAVQKQYDANLEAGTAKLKQMLSSRCELVKLTNIDGRLLVVVDGAVCPEEREHIFSSLETTAFQRTEFARPDTRQFRHLVAEHHIEDIAESDLYFVVRALVWMFFVDSEQMHFDQPFRVYTNAVTYGDVAFMHQDSCDENQVTVIFYSNRQWASHLGGETMFYNQREEVVEAVEPRPGRLCLFHGTIPHKGSPPGRLFLGNRYTTAFKFFTSKKDDEVERQETEA